jgi:hypothetical protein
MLGDFLGAVAGYWAFVAREPVYPLLTIIVLVTLVCAIQRTRIGILTGKLAAAEQQNVATLKALGALSGSEALVRVGELRARIETLRHALHLITDRLDLAGRDSRHELAAAEAAAAADLRAAEEALDKRIKALDLDLAQVVAYSYAEPEETIERAPVAA